MMYNPPHPGKLIQEYMEGLGLTITALAAHLKVTRAALSRIVNGKAAISPDMALRLGAAFQSRPELWVDLQAQYDLWRASKAQRVKIKPIEQKAA
jgi:addiction module HigA family antidote